MMKSCREARIFGNIFLSFIVGILESSINGICDFKIYVMLSLILYIYR